jgi:hypothetical protein
MLGQLEKDGKQQIKLIVLDSNFGKVEVLVNMDYIIITIITSKLLYSVYL